MQTFTGKEYLKIDIANNYADSLGKSLWAERIAWFDQNEAILDSLVPTAEEPVLFYAGIQAWNQVKKGEPTGYMISLDATSSGIQVLSALTGDMRAGTLCNIVNTGYREDAYQNLFDIIQQRVPNLQAEYKDVKKAIMTSFYGSKAKPKELFNQDKDLIQIFENVLETYATGPWGLNNMFLDIWNPKAISYEWELPDNFKVLCPVEETIYDIVHFNERNVVVSRKENQPIKEGKSLGANVTHSIDGMIAREMVGRCNYDQKKIEILNQLVSINLRYKTSISRKEDEMVIRLWEQYKRSGFLSVRILDYLDQYNLGHVKSHVIKKLIESLPRKAFTIVTIHDCFKCCPNYGNDVRRQYNQIMAEIADSNMLTYLMQQILGAPVPYKKINSNMGKYILQAEYALS